ncbi:MAG: hypothetical protein ACFE9R_14235 [Candidatus Hermodarchaeota archaeon]
MAFVNLILFPHFIVMLIAVIFFSISISAVAFHKPKNWLIIHQTFASLGLLTGILGLILLGGLNLGILHGILGLIVIISFIAIVSIGLIAIKKKNRNVRKFHIWLSRIIYVLSLLLVVLGIITFLF